MHGRIESAVFLCFTCVRDGVRECVALLKRKPQIIAGTVQLRKYFVDDWCDNFPSCVCESPQTSSLSISASAYTRK